MFHLGRTADGASTLEDRKKGLAYLQEAIDNDPGDAHAYAGLAAGYAMLGHGPDPPPDAWPRARAAALRAVTLAPDLAEAHAAMADVKLYYEWDWVGAEQAFQRANQLNPNLAMNHYHYAWYLALVDRLDEAITEHRRAQDLDPLTPLHTAWLGQLYTHGGRYDEAMAEAKKSLDINENFGVGWFVLGNAYTEQGRHDEAIAAQKRAAAINPSWSFALGHAYARAGLIEEATQILAELQARPRTSYNAFALSVLHAALGDLDEAFKWIAYEPHHAWVPWVRVEPHSAGLWDDPRFRSLLDRMKLPQRRAKAR
jgi:tetratricopeptide (TPR) repeat protein